MSFRRSFQKNELSFLEEKRLHLGSQAKEYNITKSRKMRSICRWGLNINRLSVAAADVLLQRTETEPHRARRAGNTQQYTKVRTESFPGIYITLSVILLWFVGGNKPQCCPKYWYNNPFIFNLHGLITNRLRTCLFVPLHWLVDRASADKSHQISGDKADL